MKGRFRVGLLLMMALAMVVSSLAGCAPAAEEEEVVVTEEEVVVLPRTEVEELPPTHMCPVCGKDVNVFEQEEAGLIMNVKAYVPSYSSTKVFWFCLEDCKAKFTEEPAKYLDKCATCGILIHKGEAEAAGRTSVYEGKTYYFNSFQCKKSFDADPAKAAAKLTECPVCGITLVKEHCELSGLTTEREGVTYYFGSLVCKEMFEADPEKYVK